MLTRLCTSAVVALAIFSVSASPLETDLEHAAIAGSSPLEKRATFQWRFCTSHLSFHSSLQGLIMA